MNTCDTCKWWFSDNEKHYEPHELHWCANLSKIDRYVEDGLAVEADSPCAVVTGAKFGCIHWEKKTI